MSTQKLRSDVLVFGEDNTGTEDIFDVGMQYMYHCYTKEVVLKH